MTGKVRFRPSARADLEALYVYISEQSGPARAWAYIQRIEILCSNLETMPSRGRSRHELGPGIRTISFERRAIIAYRVDDIGVNIIRIFHAGRDYASEDFSG